MNKIVLSLMVVAVLAVTLGASGIAFAQGPQTPQNPGSGYVPGGRGARGGMANQGVTGSQDGFLHDEMVIAFAGKLGLTVDEINARLAAGETVSQIAFSKGYTYEQFRTLQVEARAQALALAVENGKLTQEQADWMSQRGPGISGNRGAGMGRNTNPACPYVTQPAQ